MSLQCNAGALEDKNLSFQPNVMFRFDEDKALCMQTHITSRFFLKPEMSCHIHTCAFELL